ncbi:TRAP transporter small permease [Hydrogenophaga sp.]|uniref:TRAP transporter small permease n=1 Tax=Hydrogenophaga sp. TaxID=1904254 RepID=UPI003566514A
MKERSMLGQASRLLTGVAGIALLVMTLWTVVDVLTRYLLSKPLQGSIDLVESTLVLVVFLALPECFRREEQVVVDVVDHLIPAPAVEYLKLFAAVATLLFLVVLGYTGMQPLLDAWQFGDRKPDLPVPIFALLGVIQVAIAVSVVVLGRKLFVQLKRVVQGGAA